MPGLFSKKKKPRKTGQGWGDDAWGDPAGSLPPPQATATPPPQAARFAARTELLGALEPIFLFICEQHRIVREQGDASYERVRGKMEELLRELKEKAHRDPHLNRQLEKLYPPLIFFIDYTFAAEECGFPFFNVWHDNRIGAKQRLYGEDGNLAGDEAFFDYLDDALAGDPEDIANNERLAFYYACIGLGFTGFYFHKDNEDQTALRNYMLRIYPRINHLVELHPEGKLTEEAYEHTNRKDFVSRARERPLFLVAAIFSLILTLLLGYSLAYDSKKKALTSALKNIDAFVNPGDKPNPE